MTNSPLMQKDGSFDAPRNCICPIKLFVANLLRGAKTGVHSVSNGVARSIDSRFLTAAINACAVLCVEGAGRAMFLGFIKLPNSGLNR